jgi:two-component system, OmpR family, phosphate regulon response regulator PhoB
MKNTILIVEDNKDLQTIYTRILSDRYNLLQAYDTKQAWDHLKKRKPDLILLDLILPQGETGEKLYANLTKDPAYSSIPVIFATVIGENIERSNYPLMNEASWITKPFTKEDLLQKIEEKLKPKTGKENNVT